MKHTPFACLVGRFLGLKLRLVIWVYTAVSRFLIGQKWWTALAGVQCFGILTDGEYCGIAFEKCRLHVYPREVYHPAFGEYVSIHSLFKCAVCIWDLSMNTQQFWYAACSKCVSCKGSQTQIHPFLYAQSSLDIALQWQVWEKPTSLFWLGFVFFTCLYLWRKRRL